MALTEDGKVYHWSRGTPMASQTGILSENLSLDSEELSANINSKKNLQTMPMPPVTKLVAGPTYGAAITTAGQLYVFLTSSPQCTNRGECLESTIAELYIPNSNSPSVYSPFKPQLAKVLDQGSSPTIVDTAIGFNHVVALTREGEVFTAGDGMHGQLGEGEAQFKLHAEKHQMCESEESWEFAEYWQKIDIAEEERMRGSGAGKKGKIVAVQAGYDSTLLITG